MCALWQPESFWFAEFEDWEDWATEDPNLIDAITRGVFVPVNIGADGAYQIDVRWTEDASLTGRERNCLVVSSEPYLLISQGWFALGGLEDVGDAEATAASRMPLPAGRYDVTVHLIDWKLEPDSVGPDGRPSASALSDFVVLVAPAGDGPHRTELLSFDPPE
jgi:hypothetical protein